MPMKLSKDIFSTTTATYHSVVFLCLLDPGTGSSVLRFLHSEPDDVLGAVCDLFNPIKQTKWVLKIFQTSNFTIKTFKAIILICFAHCYENKCQWSQPLA